MSDPLIDQKWQELGGEDFLGAPVGDDFPAGKVAHPGGLKGPQKKVGRGRQYQKGFIYHLHAQGASAAAVHEVHGLILAKWGKLGRSGFAVGWLGFPLSDEADLKGGKGRCNRFENGIITWKKGAAEAFELHGAIRQKWSALGGSLADLGYPITDETGTPDGVGRFNHFEHGSIYWTPSVGAHAVWGLIRKHWAANGWERNPALGYPISDEKPSPKGRFSDFENGVVFWKSGSANAAELVPLFGEASQDPMDVVNAVKKEITASISSLGNDLPDGVSGVQITKNPGPLVGFDNVTAGRAPWVTAYRPGKTRTVNRRLQFTVAFALVVDGSNDIDVTLNLDIELYAKGHNIMSRIEHFTYHVEVDFPTTFGADADEVGAILKGKLKALKPRVVGTVDGVTLLSVKIQSDGSLNSYIEPVI